MGSKAEGLKKLTEKLEELKSRLPEHCSGTEGYVGVHRASPELLQKIEDLEERIKELKASTDSSGS